MEKLRTILFEIGCAASAAAEWLMKYESFVIFISSMIGVCIGGWMAYHLVPLIAQR